jgi:hypothetical protein
MVDRYCIIHGSVYTRHLFKYINESIIMIVIEGSVGRCRGTQQFSDVRTREL